MSGRFKIHTPNIVVAGTRNLQGYSNPAHSNAEFLSRVWGLQDRIRTFERGYRKRLRARTKGVQTKRKIKSRGKVYKKNYSVYYIPGRFVYHA